MKRDRGKRIEAFLAEIAGEIIGQAESAGPIAMDQRPFRAQPPEPWGLFRLMTSQAMASALTARAVIPTLDGRDGG